MKRPHILFITTDQQHPEYIGYRNPLVDTPHLDALAANGVILNRSYSCCPTCTPSRASWLTGQYPFTHGAWQIGTSLPENALSVARILGESGYRTALFGKSHLQSCGVNPRRSTVESPPTSLDTGRFKNWNGPWYGFDHVEMNVGHVNEEHSASMHYRVWLESKGVPIDDHFRAKRDDDYGPGRWDLPVEFHPSVWAAERTIAYLENHARDSEDPFYINLHFPEPHRPFKAPSPYWEQFAKTEIPKPKRKWGEQRDKSSIYQMLLDDQLHDQGLQADPDIRIPAVADAHRFHEPEFAEEYSPEEKDRIRAYLAMLKLVDDQVGRVIGALKENGLYDETLIVFTSDHGDYLGDHFLWSKGLLHYDGATRVPTFFHAPGFLPAGTTTEALFSNVDFAPTFLDIAGVSIPSAMQGLSQKDCLLGEPGKRAGVLVDYKAEKRLYTLSWITERYRLSLYYTPETREIELFDLLEDPDEYENRAGWPELQPTVQRLTHELFAERLFLDSDPWPSRRSFA